MSEQPARLRGHGKVNALMSSGYTRLVLKDVEVTARIGLDPWERQRPQRLLVNIELYAASQDYLREVTVNSMIDYAPLYAHIQSWQTRAHTELVETLASDLLSVCFESASVVACKVTVAKPDVFDRAQCAGVEVFMNRLDYERGAKRMRAMHSSY